MRERSTTAKFRVGDIVATPDGGHGPIKSVVGNSIVAIYVGDSIYEPRNLKLLRRPVQVGDHVVHVDNLGGAPVAVRQQDLKNPGWDEWRHADGTPIEPPQREDVIAIGLCDPKAGRLRVTHGTDQWSARGAPQSYSAMQAAADQASMYLGGQNENRGGSACIQNAYQQRPSYETSSVCRDDTCEAGRRWKPRAEQGEALLEKEMDRNNRLGDEAGALRTENDDLLRENARLRRTIEKLEKRRG